MAPHSLPRPGRRLVVALSGVALAVSVSGCDQRGGLGEADGEPTLLEASPEWMRGTEADVQTRLQSLERAIRALRADTSSGWTGRQDERTGYLASLSGGGWTVPEETDPAAVADALFDSYGEDLFGITADDLDLAEARPSPVGTSHTIRATQVVDDVPVVDAQLVLNLVDARTAPRVTSVLGRVFDGLDVATVPEVSARRATAVARELSGATPQGRPELVVLPDDTGVLAWRILVAGTATGGDAPFAGGEYFIDARTGEVVELRPTSVLGELAIDEPAASGSATSRGRWGARQLRPVRVGPLPESQSKPVPRQVLRRQSLQGGEPVQITGSNPLTGPLTATGVRVPQGVELVDTTLPFYDPATGQGAIETYDATGLTQETADRLPGSLLVFPGTEVPDGDAIAAHNYARAVLDYYNGLGWTSWDGRGGTLRSSVHFGEADYCNAMFTGFQMVYGNTCTEGGVPQAAAGFSIDTAGHEITHGVTRSSAGLVYTGQSGALDESFADYIGNVIGNRYTGDDSDAYSEHRCAGITPPTRVCRANPDGTASGRFLPNGTDMHDYALLLAPGLRLSDYGYSQDHGGVHLNSAIWNNALWSIRKRLGQIDGLPGNDSPLAQTFDGIVFHALTTYLGPTSEFLDARVAIEQSIADAGGDPTIGQVAREIFDQSGICAGCTQIGLVSGALVGASSSPEIEPTASGDQVAWLDMGGNRIVGNAVVSTEGEAPADAGLGSDLMSVAYAGDALVGYDLDGGVLRLGPDGTVTPIGNDADRATRATGLAGSAEGAAWVSSTEAFFVDAAGAVTSTRLPPSNYQFLSIATGGGTVALGDGGGNVWAWRPGGEVTSVGTTGEPVVTLAVHGDRALAVDLAGRATLFTAGGSTVLSTSAEPFGAALDDRFAVWTEATGSLGGDVLALAEREFPETDLFLHSFASGTTYDVMPVPGQQGFPVLTGDRLVWQDAVYGDNDILYGTLPQGL